MAGFTEKDWRNATTHEGGGDTSTPISAAALEDLETRLSDYTDLLAGALHPLDYGCVGDGVTNDQTAFQNAVNALAAGQVLDLSGLTYKVNTGITVSTANVILMNGKLLGGTNTALTVSAADVTCRDMRFARSTSAGAVDDTTQERACVVVNGARFRSLNCDYTNANLHCLHIVNATGNGTVIKGGRITNSSARQGSACIAAYDGGGTNLNEQIIVDGVEIAGPCALGVVLYDSARCKIINNSITDIIELPRLNLTTWTVYAGNVYWAADRTDGETQILFDNGTQRNRNTATPTAPGNNEWGATGGTVFLNIGGVDPDTHTIQSRINSGYGIEIYVSGGSVTEAHENLLAHNTIWDTGGPAIDLAFGSISIAARNRLRSNSIYNAGTAGVQDGSHAWGGIGIDGGVDTSVIGDTIDLTGTDVPGIQVINSGIGKIADVQISNAGNQGILAQTGTWFITDCQAKDCASTGFYGSSGITFENCQADNTPLQTKIYDGIQHQVAAGDPTATITARPGSTFRRTDGTASTTFYVKEYGTGTAGWAAK